MINPEALRAGPEEPIEPKPLLVLAETEVSKALIKRIEAAFAYTKQIRRLGESRSDSEIEITLFYMSAVERMSQISNPEETIGVFDRKRCQELTFTAMAAYGFNPNIFKPEYTSGGFDASGTSQHNDGTSRQLLDYPSQTIPGLHFKRWLDSYTESGAPIAVAWSVVGQKRPFRERLKNLFRQPTGAAI